MDSIVAIPAGSRVSPPTPVGQMPEYVRRQFLAPAGTAAVVETSRTLPQLGFARSVGTLGAMRLAKRMPMVTFRDIFNRCEGDPQRREIVLIWYIDRRRSDRLSGRCEK
jgi:hypothetical protein